MALYPTRRDFEPKTNVGFEEVAAQLRQWAVQGADFVCRHAIGTAARLLG
jgi:hypothetical protein